MEQEVIKMILIDRGYSEKNAILASKELQNLAEPLMPLLERWLADVDDKGDYEIAGYSICQLQKERRMKYPAALLTIDWLIKEPDAALESLRKTR